MPEPKPKFAPPIHWLLLAVHPPLFLYAVNTDQFSADVMATPMLAIVLVAAALWLGLTKFLNSGRKAALMVSLLLAVVFTYGHATRLIGNPHWFVGRVHIGHNKILLPIYLLVLIGGCVWIVRTKLELRVITRVMNFLAAALVLTAAVLVAHARLTRPPLEHVIYPLPAAPEAAPTKVLPNIYYIVADGYGRSDVLRELYKHDNTPFLDHLRGQGFVVADAALANYPQTALSMAAALNMTYLDELSERMGDSADRQPARDLSADSIVFRFLRKRNYRIVSFASGAEVTPRRGVDTWLAGGLDLGEFGEALVGGTPLPVLAGGLRRHDVHRRRIRYTLQTLPETAQMDGPIFVLAHILSPHPPFVFNADGSDRDSGREFTVDDGSHFLKHRNATREEYIEGYKAQAAFMDTQLATAIDGIIANSKRPTIIIVQGDHGPGAYLDWDSADGSNVRERLAILSAYRLPAVGDTPAPKIWPQISPANSFRLILSHYFGADFSPPKLADRAFFSTVSLPYRFTDVTQRCRPSATTQATQSAPYIPPWRPSPGEQTSP